MRLMVSAAAAAAADGANSPISKAALGKYAGQQGAALPAADPSIMERDSSTGHMP